MKSAGVLHSVLGSVLGGKMPFSWCELLQHLMKLPLPGGRNKLMTKLLKLIKYQKNSRAFFLLSSRIKSGFWCMMDSTGHIYGSFRHNDLSSLINNSSVSQFKPWSSPETHTLLRFLGKRSKTKSAHELIQNNGGVHEKYWWLITPCCFSTQFHKKHLKYSILKLSVSLIRSVEIATISNDPQNTSIWVLDKKGSIQLSG